tara:strand:+ start:1055 stop:1900 length:846 start_codon:yes stop_codon:yes gene_type:complete
MNADINNDIRYATNKITDNIKTETEKIRQSALDMGNDIKNTVESTATKGRQLVERVITNAEGVANDTRIRATNKANEIQQQAIEMKDEAVSKANEMKDQAFLTANNLKDQAGVALGIQQEKQQTLFSRLDPRQYLKLPTLSKITGFFSPKNLFCGNNTSNNTNNLGLPQIGGNGKQAIVELLQYNLEKRSKILNILFEDAMKIAATKGNVSKNKEKSILKLIHEIDIIKNKINSLNRGLPKVKRTISRKRTKTARKSRKKKSNKSKKRRRKHKKRTRRRRK